MVKAKLTYYRKIFSDLDKRELSNLYLLHGPEYYIMEEMAGKIASSIVPDDLKSFNMTLAYGAEVDMDQFVRTARSFPFLSDKRVLLLKEMERLKGSWKSLVSYCEDPAPSSVVIMLFGKTIETAKGLQETRSSGQGARPGAHLRQASRRRADTVDHPESQADEY